MMLLARSLGPHIVMVVPGTCSSAITTNGNDAGGADDVHRRRVVRC
jgi:hypothetical protein